MFRFSVCITFAGTSDKDLAVVYGILFVSKVCTTKNG